MAELKRYKTTINGLETEVQLTDEQAEAQGLTGGTDSPVSEHDSHHVRHSTTATATDDGTGVGVKEASAPTNKSRAARKND